MAGAGDAAVPGEPVLPAEEPCGEVSAARVGTGAPARAGPRCRLCPWRPTHRCPCEPPSAAAGFFFGRTLLVCFPSVAFSSACLSSALFGAASSSAFWSLASSSAFRLAASAFAVASVRPRFSSDRLPVPLRCAARVPRSHRGCRRPRGRCSRGRRCRSARLSRSRTRTAWSAVSSSRRRTCRGRRIRRCRRR